MNFLLILTFLCLQLFSGSTEALRCHICFPDKSDEYCRKNSTVALCPSPTYNRCLLRVAVYRHNTTNRLETFWAQSCFPQSLCQGACEPNFLGKKKGYVLSNCTISCCNGSLCNGPLRQNISAPNGTPMPTSEPINLQSTSPSHPPPNNTTETSTPSGGKSCFSINSVVIALALLISFMRVNSGF